MSQFFTEVGAAMLIFCFIWGYSWLEVWRDPKGELTDFYAEHPQNKTGSSLALQHQPIITPVFVL